MHYVLCIFLVIFWAFWMSAFMAIRSVTSIRTDHGEDSWCFISFWQLENILSQQGERTWSLAFQPQTPGLGCIKAHHRSSLGQARHLRSAGEAPTGLGRAGHEAEIWLRGKAEPWMALPGRDCVCSQSGESPALRFGESRCCAPKALPLSCLPANAKPHGDTHTPAEGN